jgi:DNA-binding IclR family transcriptional regulator
VTSNLKINKRELSDYRRNVYIVSGDLFGGIVGRRRQESSDSASSLSQTLDRGITALEMIAFSDEPVSVADLAERMDLSKSVVYRLIRTLEARRFVRRTSQSRYEPSLYLGRVGAKSYRPLQAAAVPHMRKLANDLGHTTYVAMREGDEIVTVWVEEPTTTDTVAYRPSVRHGVGKGATWIALTAGEPPSNEDTREVLKAREVGVAFTTGQVIPGLSAMASPIIAAGGECVGVLATVFLNRNEDTMFIGRKLMVAAQLIGDELA